MSSSSSRPNRYAPRDPHRHTVALWSPSRLTLRAPTFQVLTRPWCLLELYEAHLHQLPVVLLVVENGGFDLDRGLAFVQSLETDLEVLNPGALATIEAHLYTTGTSLADFKAGVLSALEAVAQADGGRRVVWHPWGSDNAMVADAKDLIGAMATATNRTVVWKQSPVERAAERASSLAELPMSRMSFRSPKQPQSYAAFVSYFRAEAGADARLLHNQIEILMGRPAFLDASYAKDVSGGVDADEIRNILEKGLGRSEAVVLLQTKECLTRPWVLLELYTASKLRIPVIPVALAGKGYDFKQAKSFLDNLETELEVANPGAVKAINDYLAVSAQQSGTAPETLKDVKQAVQAIPKLISVALDPEGSSNQLEAAVRDIVQKVATKKRAEFDKRKEDKVPPAPGSSDKTAPTSSAQIEVSIVKGE